MNPALMLDSLLAYAPVQPRALRRAYDQETFRQFLTLERKRARRSARSFLIVLVGLKPDAGLGPDDSSEMPRGVAAPLFAGLEQCVREVDFIGWYRDGRIAAAVLTQGTEPQADALARVRARVMRALGQRLPSRAAKRVDVRVLRIGGGTRC